MKTFAKFAFALLFLTSFAFIPAEKSKTITVVIDVSHGGKDTGITTGNMLEKEIVQQIAAKMALLNNNKNIKLHFTRNDDSFVSLQDRVKYINDIAPDMVISLHTNEYSTKSPSGFEVFYSDKGHDVSGSKKLANLFFDTMKEEAIFKTTSPAKTAPFYLLRKSKAPSVTLELGFLTNPEDAATITNEKQQELIAKTLLKAIRAFK